MCFSYNCGWKELQICSGRCVCCRYVGYRDTSSPALRPHRLPATSTVLLVLLESLRNHEKSMAESLGMLDRAWNSGCLPMNLFSLQRWFRAQKQHRTLVQQPGLMLSCPSMAQAGHRCSVGHIELPMWQHRIQPTESFVCAIARMQAAASHSKHWMQWQVVWSPKLTWLQ